MYSRLNRQTLAKTEFVKKYNTYKLNNKIIKFIGFFNCEKNCKQ